MNIDELLTVQMHNRTWAMGSSYKHTMPAKDARMPILSVWTTCGWSSWASGCMWESDRILSTLQEVHQTSWMDWTWTPVPYELKYCCRTFKWRSSWSSRAASTKASATGCSWFTSQTSALDNCNSWTSSFDWINTVPKEGTVVLGRHSHLTYLDV